MVTESAVLRLVAYGGNAINAGVFKALIGNDIQGQGNFLANFGSQTLQTERPGKYPVYVRQQPASKPLIFDVVIVPHTQANLELLQSYFDPNLGQQYLTALDDNGDTRRILCQAENYVWVSSNRWRITLNATTPVWENVTLETDTKVITVTGQTTTITNKGDTAAYPTFDITPNTAKAHANDYIRRRRISIANRSEQPLYDPVGIGYPIDITDGGLDTATLFGGGKVLDNLNDVRIFLHSEEQSRWPSPATSDAATKLWANLSFRPGKLATLETSIGSGAPDFTVSNATGFAGWPNSGFLLVDTECIQYTDRTPRSTGILTRGARGTTPASHTAGAIVYYVDHPYIDLVYDYTGATAADPDPDSKPGIDLDLSANNLHTWTGPFFNDNDLRTRMWQRLSTEEILSIRGFDDTVTGTAKFENQPPVAGKPAFNNMSINLNVLMKANTDDMVTVEADIPPNLILSGIVEDNEGYPSTLFKRAYPNPYEGQIYANGFWQLYDGLAGPAVQGDTARGGGAMYWWLTNLAMQAYVNEQGGGPTGTVGPIPPGRTSSYQDWFTNCKFTSIGQISDYLDIYNFGISVPNDATILGIKVDIQHVCANTTTPGTVEDETIQILKAGVGSGDNKAMVGTGWAGHGPTFGITNSTPTRYGTGTDMWGLTLTPADVNNTAFGIRIAARSIGAGAWAEVESVTIAVHYATAESLAGPPAVSSAVAIKKLALDVKPVLVTGETNLEDAVTTGVYGQFSNYTVKVPDPVWQDEFHNEGVSGPQTLPGIHFKLDADTSIDGIMLGMYGEFAPALHIYTSSTNAEGHEVPDLFLLELFPAGANGINAPGTLSNDPVLTTKYLLLNHDPDKPAPVELLAGGYWLIFAGGSNTFGLAMRPSRTNAEVFFGNNISAPARSETEQHFLGWDGTTVEVLPAQIDLPPGKTFAQNLDAGGGAGQFVLARAGGGSIPSAPVFVELPPNQFMGWNFTGSNDYSHSPVFGIVSKTSPAQVDAPTKSDATVIIDNIVIQLDDVTPRTPLIVVGPEEPLYLMQGLLTNDTTGESLSIFFPMAVGQSVRIDCASRTITDMETNRPIMFTISASEPNEWIHLAKGDNTIRYNEVGVVNTTIVTTWRSRWL